MTPSNGYLSHAPDSHMGVRMVGGVKRAFAILLVLSIMSIPAMGMSSGRAMKTPMEIPQSSMGAHATITEPHLPGP